MPGTSFLETVESMQTEAASVRDTFSYERQDDGFTQPVRGRMTPARTLQLARAARVLRDVQEGRLSPYVLREAMTTSDFPLMFGQIVDRMLLGNYQMTQPTYPAYVRVGKVRDFRTVNRFALNGGQDLLQLVPERSEYPMRKLSEARYQYSVQKYGAVLPISWEALIDDQLGAFDDIPMRLAQAARNTEENFVTGLFTSSTGFNTTFFSNTNKNIINTTNGASTTNPSLSIAALQDAWTVLSKQTDVDGNPITIQAAVLVVPPALKVVAQNILNATQLWITASAAGGVPNVENTTSSPTATGMQQLITNNWFKGLVDVVVNPWLPIVDTTHGNTTWYLFASPNTGRPAIEIGFLAGHEAPELYMKDLNAIRIGGGAAGGADGDFDTDTVQYKVRAVFGGTLMDVKMAVVSNGTGS